MWRPDTKRFTWKWFGGHGGDGIWGFNSRTGSHGNYWRRQLHKAERRYYKNYAKAFEDDPEIEPYVRDNRSVFRSIVDWRNS